MMTLYVYEDKILFYANRSITLIRWCIADFVQRICIINTVDDADF